MRDFSYNDSAWKILDQMIAWMRSNGVDVEFVLTPYHPELFAMMERQAPIFLEIEESVRSLADALNIEIVGSYDPRVSGCVDQDFYDGMHPKERCMQKVLERR